MVFVSGFVFEFDLFSLFYLICDIDYFKVVIVGLVGEKFGGFVE